MSEQTIHSELRCQNPHCTYSMVGKIGVAVAVAGYLRQLSEDVLDGTVRHVSVSVHREEQK